MIHKTVDLYEYFKVKKPDGATGFLTTYVRQSYPELDSGRKRPAMLVIPGGAYEFVSDRENEPVVISWLEKGYNVFALKYSVAPVSYPYQLCEACMAIAYIRENADEFFVDPRHVAAVGFSAGGHLCGTLATLYDDENVLKLIGKRRVSFRPDAVIMSYAVSYNSHGGTFNNISAKNDDLKKYLTVIDRVNESSSPAFIWHTRQDELVPVDNALKLALAYHKANVPFALHIYDKGAHGLSTATEEVANSAKSTAISDEVSTWVDLAYMWLKNSLGFKIIHSADKD